MRFSVLITWARLLPCAWCLAGSTLFLFFCFIFTIIFHIFDFTNFTVHLGDLLNELKLICNYIKKYWATRPLSNSTCKTRLRKNYFYFIFYTYVFSEKMSTVQFQSRFSRVTVGIFVSRPHFDPVDDQSAWSRDKLYADSTSTGTGPELDCNWTVVSAALFGHD